MANVLSAVIDGLALRSLGDPSSDLIDHDSKRTLLGTAALAVIHSFLERAGQGDGMTLEQAVHAKVYGQPRARRNAQLRASATGQCNVAGRRGGQRRSAPRWPVTVMFAT